MFFRVIFRLPIYWDEISYADEEYISFIKKSNVFELQVSFRTDPFPIDFKTVWLTSFKKMFRIG